MMANTNKKLEDNGLTLGDLVTYLCDDDSTGGIIFRIVKDVKPTPWTITEKQQKRIRKSYNWETRSTVETEETITVYGNWTDKGKSVTGKELHGYVRIAPAYSFFPTRKGQNPKHKDGTIILWYNQIRMNLKKVGIMEVGAKYVELGNFLRDLAMKNGMTDETSEETSD